MKNRDADSILRLNLEFSFRNQRHFASRCAKTGNPHPPRTGSASAPLQPGGGFAEGVHGACRVFARDLHAASAAGERRPHPQPSPRGEMPVVRAVFPVMAPPDRVRAPLIAAGAPMCEK